MTLQSVFGKINALNIANTKDQNAEESGNGENHLINLLRSLKSWNKSEVST